MKPAQLGWDTAMQIYSPHTKDPIKVKPSYKVAHNCRGVDGNGRHNIHWVIDVEKDGEVKKYIAVAIISALRSSEICSRATVVYEVVEFDEKEKPKKVRTGHDFYRIIY